MNATTASREWNAICRSSRNGCTVLRESVRADAEAGMGAASGFGPAISVSLVVRAPAEPDLDQRQQYQDRAEDDRHRRRYAEAMELEPFFVDTERRYLRQIAGAAV